MANSRRWSQEDFNSTFEEFLKTPISSKGDTDKIKKLLEKPVKNVKEVNSTSLWWANDSDDESLKKSKSKSFMKTKKPESPGRNRNNNDPKVNKGSNHNNKQPASPRRAAGRSRDPQKSKKQVSPNKLRGSKSNPSMSKDSLEDISEKSEEHDHLQNERRGKRNNDINPVISIHDSSIDTSASYEGIPAAPNKDIPLGSDTLDEMADKHNFFQNLEKSADGTVDYSRLNQELGQTGGTTLMSPAARVARMDISGVSGSPADTSTPARPRTGEREDQKPSMLSKVALMDSLESTFNTDASPKIGNSRDGTLPDTLKTPAQSGIMGTNTSREMEDLQRVLQEAELTPTIYGADSRPATAKTGIEALMADDVIDGNRNHNNTASPPIPADRSVGDIFREIDAIERRGRDIENGHDDDDDVQLRSNYKSPRGLPFQNRFDQDNQDFQPVTSVTVKDKRKKEIKTDHQANRNIPTNSSTTTTTFHTDRVTPSSRDRYSHVQSSGYGRPTSPQNKMSRSRSASGQRSMQQSTKGQSAGEDFSPRRMTRGQSVREDISPRRTSFSGKSSPLKGASPRVTPRNKYQNTGVSHASPEHSFLKESLEAVLDSYLKEHQLSAQTSPQREERRDQEKALLDEVKDLRIQLITERNTKIKLQEDFSSKEERLRNELDAQKFKYEEEVFSLKQENFVLVAKVKEYEAEKDTKAGKSTNVSKESEDHTDSRLARLEHEIQEQETLLASYQAENKRLYDEIKGFQKQAKATEGSMFKENQRLTLELTNLKQELELKSNQLQNKGVITSIAAQQQIAAGNAEAMIGASRVAHLEGELTEAKRVQDSQSREIREMQQAQWEKDRVVETIIKEKESLAKKLAESLTPEQVHTLKAQHKEEIEKLHKKLRWYAENQDLLDKSSAKLRAKEEEVHKLHLRLEDFKSEAGRKLEENKLRNKEKAANTKRIQDLERQVKEMEQVIRRRHPNSLPAMMMVAAQVPDSVLLNGTVTASDGSLQSSRSTQVLEARVKKLEGELESKDEAARTDLRAMEQKYNHVKLQFEERIADLEHQLSIYRGIGADLSSSDGHAKSVKSIARPHSHMLALERELDNVKDRARKQVAESHAEVDRLTTELNKVKKNQDNLMRNESRVNEGHWKSKVASLEEEVKAREQDIQLLHRTVEKLRSRTGKKGAADGNQWPAHPHAPASASKEYQSSNFADTQVSAALEENQRLHTKVEQLQLELDQQRVDLRRSLAQTEAQARHTQESLENQIETMRSSHQQEIQRMIANQALHSSSSRIAELQNKCDTQEVMITHLKTQLKTANNDLEELTKVKARETELKAQVDDLQSRLHEARQSHTPGMRHFESLEDKLSSLVQRQKRREEELDTVVRGSHTMLGRAELEEEVDKWKKQVEMKNQQLQSFRAELDAILEVLKTLQRQGITLPVGPLYS